MNKFFLFGSMLLEVLISITLFYVVSVLFIQSSKIILELESFSKNINIAIGLAEYKSIDCRRISFINHCDQSILNKHGSFKLMNNFSWTCKFKHLWYYSFNNVYAKNGVKNMYENDIHFILYKMLKRILYKKMMRLDIIIFWERNSIRLITYINTSNDK